MPAVFPSSSASRSLLPGRILPPACSFRALSTEQGFAIGRARACPRVPRTCRRTPHGGAGLTRAPWSGIAVALSSFPTNLKMRPGEVKQFPRTDLPVYRKLISNPKALLRTQMFGDYAVDTSPIVKPQRRTPSAHFRYSTPTGYAIAKGTTVKKPHGYEAIYPVAGLLASRAFFMGSEFSDGDKFIVSLQNRTSAKGNAATWRWASTDHHLTCNVNSIAKLYGLAPIEEKTLSAAAPKQIEFQYADEGLSTAPDTEAEPEE
ncbi:beta family protein [Bradyrhizobium tunisiense]|uniref:beta family protein n=1 Tax=Bradyrhizobium tunisiense TaxID=3278709 RepID=UPI0035DCA024